MNGSSPDGSGFRTKKENDDCCLEKTVNAALLSNCYKKGSCSMRVFCLQFERFFAYLIFILPQREKKKKFSFFPSFSWKPFPSRWCVYAAKQAAFLFAYSWWVAGPAAAI